MIAPESSAASDVLLSPNHGERRLGPPDAVILHYTGMKTAEAALARLTDPRSEVSCHYFIWEDGRITQLVPEGRRAWHAGRSCWRGERDVNSISLGIEIVNPGHDFGAPPFHAAQIEAVIRLCRDLIDRWPAPPARVLAHSDVAPARKRDPGEIFPWAELAAAGVGLWTRPIPPTDEAGALRRGASGPSVLALQEALGAYGYDVAPSGAFGQGTEECVRAFQRHFRPARVDGVADISTRQTLRDLCESLSLATLL